MLQLLANVCVFGLIAGFSALSALNPVVYYQQGLNLRDVMATSLRKAPRGPLPLAHTQWFARRAG